jgi:hypothetical protein
MKNYALAASLLFLMAACKQNKSSDLVKDNGFTTDTSHHYYPAAPQNNTQPFGVFDSTDFVKNKGGEASRRELLFMSIDSTYSAINQIEIIKNEMNSQAITRFSMQERNMRAKALNQLNILENMLARQADQAVLTNLKQHTERLRAINEKTEANTEQLHELSDKLVRAGLIMQNVTNVLTFCVSKGVIKPATPVKATAADVKAGVN